MVSPAEHKHGNEAVVDGELHIGTKSVAHHGDFFGLQPQQSFHRLAYRAVGLAANEQRTYARRFFYQRDKRADIGLHSALFRTVDIGVSGYVRHAVPYKVAQFFQPRIVERGVEAHHCEVGFGFGQRYAAALEFGAKVSVAEKKNLFAGVVTA